MIRNVLLIIDRFGTGGAQTQLSLICAEMIRIGITVTVFTYHPSDYYLHRANLAGARLIERFKQTRSGIDIVRALSSEIGRGDYQAVIAFLVGSCAYAEIACQMARYRGTLIVGERNTFLGGVPTFRQWVQRAGHYFADYVVTNSEPQREALATWFPFLRKRIRCITNAVDTKKYAVATHSQLPNSVYRLLVVARVVREKNALGLARALATLHHMGFREANVEWVGKVHDELYFQECQQQISTLGLISHWQWHPETDDLLKHYLGAHIFVLPSFHEGMPNVVCEALACGLPCAISNLPESAWLIDGDSNGRLFDPSDENSIAQSIQDIITLEVGELRNMQKSAVAFANSRLSIQHMTQEYLGLMKGSFLQ